MISRCVLQEEAVREIVPVNTPIQRNKSSGVVSIPKCVSGKDYIFRNSQSNTEVIDNNCRITLAGNILLDKEIVKHVNLVREEEFTLTLKEGSRPFFSKERPVDFGKRKAVEDEIHSLLKDKVLVPCEHTDLVSLIVIVSKQNGSIFMCGDFCWLNECIVDDKLPPPVIEDLLTELRSDNKFFAKIDLKESYYHIPFARSTQPLTRTLTYIGTFMYTVMPFGDEHGSVCIPKNHENFFGKM